MNSRLARTRSIPIRRGLSIPFQINGTIASAMMILSGSVRRVLISG
jgi:hypothetical protein